MRMITLPLMTLALLGGCATTGSRAERREDPGIAKALAGRVAGKPQSCLSLIDTQNSSTYDGTILYRVGARTIYRNDLNGCPIAHDDRIPVTHVYSSQICRGDIVTFIDRYSGFPSGGCSYGDFVPYRTAAK